jgi:hypothetical protein
VSAPQAQTRFIRDSFELDEKTYSAATDTDDTDDTDLLTKVESTQVPRELRDFIDPR